MVWMGFEVETLKFEGPLDLMLHLIHEQLHFDIWQN